jgi:CBS domain.
MAADFDAAPIYENTSVGTEIHGYVSREQLRTMSDATLETQIQQITPEISVESDTGIDEVISKLTNSRFVLVLSDDSVEGIITRFDLNRLPVYTHLYDSFSQFEIGLRDLLRTHNPDWNEQTDIRVPYRGQQNVVSDRLTCAELSTLVEIVHDVGLNTKLPSASKVGLDELVYLRNAVAHYNPIVHTMTERPTHDDPERGAPQLATEYSYLHTCIDTL